MPDHQDRPYDLVVLDLDGTILDRRFEHGFSQEVIDTIAAVQAAGVPVTIATGRTLDYVRAQVEILSLTQPVVTTQGAIIGDPVSGEILHEASMPMEQARQVARWADETGRVTILYFSDGDGTTRLIQNREEWEAAEYDHLFGGSRQLQATLSDLVAADDAHPPLKFITINHLANEDDLTPILQEEFGPGLHITRTHDLLVEGTAAGVDKGQGLLRLLEHLGIEPERVMAVGDNENDIPLLEVVGFGVAMGQASEKVKAVADWIAPPIEEHGAAVAMRKFVLEAMKA